ncbi:MAG TPA: DUF4406 domain-containing protein [Gaiellaceae bacterium]|nr:DUF4406 domain-containing protein [Gaiellaceae bacterium]
MTLDGIKHVYVAGPITKGDQFVNTRIAILAAARLAERGFFPFVPHLCSLWQMIEPREYHEWIDYDFAWIGRCDALVRLPGESSGADAEVRLALNLGKPVFLGLTAFFGGTAVVTSDVLRRIV